MTSTSLYSALELIKSVARNVVTVEEVVAVARYGAKVQLSPEARQRNAEPDRRALQFLDHGRIAEFCRPGALDVRFYGRRP